MKKSSLFLASLFVFSSASAAPKSSAAPSITATQMAQISTEAQDYTGKPCAAGKENIFFQQTESDPNVMMFGGMMQGYVNQAIDQAFNGMAEKGMEIRKLSAVQGGKRAYLYDKKNRQGMYMLMQLSSGSMISYGCALKK